MRCSSRPGPQWDRSRLVCMHSVASSKTIARFQCHAVPSPIFIWISTSSRRTTTKRRRRRQPKRSQSLNNTTCRTYLRVLCLSACPVRPSVLSVCHTGSALSLPPALSLSLLSLSSLSLSLSLQVVYEQTSIPIKSHLGGFFISAWGRRISSVFGIVLDGRPRLRASIIV